MITVVIWRSYHLGIYLQVTLRERRVQKGVSKDITVFGDSHSGTICQSQFHSDFSFRCGYISSLDFQLAEVPN